MIKGYIFGLLGEMQKQGLSESFKLQLPQLILAATDNLGLSETSNVLNNVCWFLGEIIVSPTNRDIVKPFLNRIAEKLSSHLNQVKLNKAVALNVAITFGRLGLVDEGEIANMHLERVTKQWLIAIKTLTKGIEKETSFRGFISMIPHNPGPILKFLPHVCSAFI